MRSRIALEKSCNWFVYISWPFLLGRWAPPFVGPVALVGLLHLKCFGFERFAQRAHPI